MRFSKMCVPALTFLFLSGCSESTQSTSKDIYVTFEVESEFQNDFVRLLLDSKTLLEAQVTTNYSVDLAWSSGLQKISNDTHTLYFAVIDYAAHNTFNIDVTNDTSTVTISFDKSTGQVRFQQYKGRLLRR